MDSPCRVFVATAAICRFVEIVAAKGTLDAADVNREADHNVTRFLFPIDKSVGGR